ncbi:MAG: stage III sporulation protein AA [Syntrophomonadaceae bacterium]|jgi:stage III sporulation protein AA|nr:stage III sporulation protein AA [Syntrophomonadaceae bacterium]
MTNESALKIRKEIVPYLPPALQSKINALDEGHYDALEEIRLRVNQPVALNMGKREVTLDDKGVLREDFKRGYIINKEDMKRTVASVSENSYYAYEEDIKRGFITLPGGHRVGLAGQVVWRGNEVGMMKNISSLCFRIAREKKGCAESLLPHIETEEGIMSALLVSPPRCGKTTILRDLARLLAGGAGDKKAKNVVIVDERSELAGCYGGVPQLDVGGHTDVLDACPKAAGMMMALRSLAPQIIVTDEIGRDEDAAAVQECLNAGVKVISSFHAASFEELKRRPATKRLLAAEAFQVGILLSRRNGPGTIQEIAGWD